MSETWLDFAIRRDAPVSKQGYSGAPQRTLEDIEGEVKHSTEGPLLAAFGELDKLERRASWTITIDADGTVYQHFPLESITWHCGVLGDRSVDTSLIGNLTLVGEEHVDRIGGVQLAELTAAATISSIRVSLAIRRLCPKVAAHPATLRLNEWEHGWLSWTACPSGLIPWDEIIPALNESPQQEESDMKLIVAKPSGRVFVLGAAGKRYIDDLEELALYSNAAGAGVEVTDTQADATPDIVSGVSGGPAVTYAITGTATPA
jgi:hypothetical protein